MMTDLNKKLADLTSHMQRARRRGDSNFYRISAEHKALKLKIKAAKKKAAT